MKRILYSLLILTGLSSCDLANEPEVGGTLLQKMSGEWYVKVYDTATPSGSYHLVTTSNTAANTSTDLLFDDHQYWPCKVVAKVDANTMQFNSISSLNNLESSTIKVKVIEGKILPKAATSTGGNKTDSIYVKFEFSDDPGVNYIYAGYKRTGFLEDEH